MISIAYHPCYELELPRGHRFPMEKYPMLKEQLIYEGTFSRENFFNFSLMFKIPVTEKVLSFTHLVFVDLKVISGNFEAKRKSLFHK